MLVPSRGGICATSCTWYTKPPTIAPAEMGVVLLGLRAFAHRLGGHVTMGVGSGTVSHSQINKTRRSEALQPGPQQVPHLLRTLNLFASPAYFRSRSSLVYGRSRGPPFPPDDLAKGSFGDGFVKESYHFVSYTKSIMMRRYTSRSFPTYSSKLRGF